MSSKISELTALGETPADDDIFPIVDTSASQTKSVTYANLRGPTSAGTKVLLEEITLSAASEFSFTGIPAGYDRLILEGNIRGDVAATNDALRLYFNADTTDTNYYYQRTMGDNGAAGVQEGAVPSIGATSAASATSGYVGYIRIAIEDYAGSDVKAAMAQWGHRSDTTDATVGMAIIHHDSLTDAITQLQIQADGHPTDGLTGTLRLYGEKSLTLEDSETITVKKAVPVTLAGGDFTIDLTDYQDGDRVVLCGNIASSGGSGVDTVGVYLNGDTTATNYQSQRFASVNTAASVSEANNAELWIVADSTTPTNAVSSVCAVINAYAESGNIKTVRGEYNAPTTSWASMWTGTNDVMHRTSTAAVTSITLSGASSLTGTLTAYIEKEGVLPVSQGPHVIETITLSTAGEFDFDNIPSGYRRLIIKGTLRGDVSATNDLLVAYLNTDTTDANYYRQNDFTKNGVADTSEGTAPYIGYAPGATSPSGTVTSLSLQVEDYAGSNVKNIHSKTVSGLTATENVSGDIGIVSSVTDAITRIRIRTDNHPTDQLTGTLTLYGEY